MTFVAKYSTEQWAEARRLRTEGLTFRLIAQRLGFKTGTTISQRAAVEGWSQGKQVASVLPAKIKPRGPSPSTVQVRRALALRLYSLIEIEIRMKELRMKKQLDACEQSPNATEPPPVSSDEQAAFAALIDNINKVTEMASEPALAADGRRKSASINPELTALSDDIDAGGLSAASEKDNLRREIAEKLEKISLHPQGADLLAAHLDREQWDKIVYDWAAHARDDQLAPVLAKGGGRWHTWLVMGGRGSGKTRTGAEWVRAQVEGELPLADRRSRRIALIADTIAQVRSVMIEGVSGLMSVYPPDHRPKLEVSRNQLVWSNGAVAQMLAADNPDSLRGPQFDAAWCDELCKWRVPDQAWDTLQFAMRLGRWPQCVITTTPRPIPLLKKIMEDLATATTRSRTADNANFLSPSFLAEMMRRYGDTLIGRQELEGEIVEERMTGLWKRSVIEQSRLLARPELTRIVVAVDPPVTSTAGSDSCGIIVAGLGVDRRAYVIADRTIQGREPTVWTKAAVAAYHDHEADTIVVETNQGGDLLVQMFKSIDVRVPVKKVYASRGKFLRAEPVSGLYNEGRVAHVGTFPELERQMCDFAADGLANGKSPDRLDALVWAITELMLAEHKEPRMRTLW